MCKYYQDAIVQATGKVYHTTRGGGYAAECLCNHKIINTVGCVLFDHPHRKIELANIHFTSTSVYTYTYVIIPT